MKAAIVEKPGVLAVRDIPRPEVGEYDALCDLLYGATCSGTDLHLIEGSFPWPVTYPTVIGHESIGRVVEVGPKVRYLKTGDLITRVGTLASPDGMFSVNWGGFAEYGIARDHWAMREDGIDAGAWQRFRVNQVLPPDTDPAAATMMTTWRETLSYATRMGVSAGASVLVIGSGGVGLSFVAQAASLGATQIVMIGNAARRDVAVAAGATGYADYGADDAPEQVARMEPDGFDFVIDAVGKAEVLDDALPLLSSGGTIGIYGIDDYGQCLLNPVRARGSFTCYSGGYDEAETHESVLAEMREGRLRAELWLDLEHPFDLEEIDKAIEAVRDRTVVKSLVRLSRGV